MCPRHQITLKGLHEDKLDLTGDQQASDRLSRLSLVLYLFEDMTTLIQILVSESGRV